MYVLIVSLILLVVITVSASFLAFGIGRRYESRKLREEGWKGEVLVLLQLQESADAPQIGRAKPGQFTFNPAEHKAVLGFVFVNTQPGQLPLISAWTDLDHEHQLYYRMAFNSEINEVIVYLIQKVVPVRYNNLIIQVNGKGSGPSIYVIRAKR